MEIKTTRRYHSTSIKMAKNYKIVTTSNAGKDVEKLGHLDIASGNAKWYSYLGEQVGSPLKK